MNYLVSGQYHPFFSLNPARFDSVLANVVGDKEAFVPNPTSCVNNNADPLMPETNNCYIQVKEIPQTSKPSTLPGLTQPISIIIRVDTNPANAERTTTPTPYFSYPILEYVFTAPMINGALTPEQGYNELRDLWNTNSRRDSVQEITIMNADLVGGGGDASSKVSKTGDSGSNLLVGTLTDNALTFIQNSTPFITAAIDGTLDINSESSLTIGNSAGFASLSGHTRLDLAAIAGDIKLQVSNAAGDVIKVSTSNESAAAYAAKITALGGGDEVPNSQWVADYVAANLAANTLAALTDVDLNTPDGNVLLGGECLRYNGTKWVNDVNLKAKFNEFAGISTTGTLSNLGLSSGGTFSANAVENMTLSSNKTLTIEGTTATTEVLIQTDTANTVVDIQDSGLIVPNSASTAPLVLANRNLLAALNAEVSTSKAIATVEYVLAHGGGGSSTLAGLTDVLLTAPTGGAPGGQALTFDGTKWINGTSILAPANGHVALGTTGTGTAVLTSADQTGVVGATTTILGTTTVGITSNTADITLTADARDIISQAGRDITLTADRHLTANITNQFVVNAADTILNGNFQILRPAAASSSYALISTSNKSAAQYAADIAIQDSAIPNKYYVDSAITAASTPVGSTYAYTIDTSAIVAPPASGRIIYNNATQTSATHLFFSHIDGDARDIEVLLKLYPVGTKIIIQDTVITADFQEWTTTTVPTVSAGSYVDFTVSLTTSGGVGTTGFPNNTKILSFFVVGSLGGGGTVTSVAALTLGTSGTDLSSTVANSTTTPVITLQVPTASAANRGALSAADWSTFSGKQDALTLTTTGTSGAATLISNTLNIPQYSGGGSAAVILAAPYPIWRIGANITPATTQYYQNAVSMFTGTATSMQFMLYATGSDDFRLGIYRANTSWDILTAVLVGMTAVTAATGLASDTIHSLNLTAVSGQNLNFTAGEPIILCCYFDGTVASWKGSTITSSTVAWSNTTNLPVGLSFPTNPASKATNSGTTPFLQLTGTA
jgi:hypothetical protein